MHRREMLIGMGAAIGTSLLPLRVMADQRVTPGVSVAELEEAAARGPVLVGDGIYRLERAIRVDGSAAFVARGADRARFVVDADSAFTSDGGMALSLTGITIEARGAPGQTLPGITANDGSVLDVADCAFVSRVNGAMRHDGISRTLLSTPRAAHGGI